MSPQISIEFTPEARAVLDRFEQLPQALPGIIAGALDPQMQLTVAHIQRARLSFPKSGPPVPEGLRVQSNRLRGSIRATKAVISGDTVTASIGSNVKYAAIHEFGGTIHRKRSSGFVRLRTDARGNLLRQGANGQLAIFAKKSHKRFESVRYQKGAYDITIPERAPIRTGIADRLTEISAALSRAIVNFWKGGGK